MAGGMAGAEPKATKTQPQPEPPVAVIAGGLGAAAPGLNKDKPAVTDAPLVDADDE